MECKTNIERESLTSTKITLSTVSLTNKAMATLAQKCKGMKQWPEGWFGIR